MKAFTIFVQCILLLLAIKGVNLSVRGYAYLYLADFILLCLCLRSMLPGRNWFVNLGIVTTLTYGLYVPLTCVIVDAANIDQIPRDYTLMQIEFALAFISGFTLAYLLTMNAEGTALIDRSTRPFSKGFDNIVLVPLILAPVVLKLVTIWATVGFAFTYTESYTAAFKLQASGFNIVNQIMNVLSGFSVVALFAFFFKEVGKGRYRYCIILLAVFLTFSLYIGSRTIFLAPMLSMTIVYARFEIIRFRLNTIALILAAYGFYYAVDLARQGPGTAENKTFALVGEPLVVFLNGMVFFGPQGESMERPPFDTYVNDFIRIIPNYIYSTGNDVSRWFMQEMFPIGYESGAGRAFGFNTEAIIHNGLSSAILQALGVGIFFGLLTRRPRRGGFYSDFIEIVVALFLVNAYLVARVTTFGLIPVISSTLIALMIVRATTAIMVAATERPPEPMSSAALIPSGAH